MPLSSYDPNPWYDELFQGKGEPRPDAAQLIKTIQGLPEGELLLRQRACEAALLRSGVTFNVYSDGAGIERIWPFDLLPRIVSAQEWRTIEEGLKQRIFALNLFLCDVYGEQKIVRDGKIPLDVVCTTTAWRSACEGLKPPRDIWCHITGTDLVRDNSGRLFVLEDNLRCPSGVSYVLENRRIIKRTFPGLFESTRVRSVDEYPSHLLELLHYIAPPADEPKVVVLTPGMYNSAYFEHSYLAQQMGVELVEGGDLVVNDGYVYMRTTHGFERVDVIYRRIDDDFMDPLTFRSDSMLGVPGLMDAYRAGHVALANAPGTGVADDKVIYAFVPDMIRYYLDEDPILANVPTYLCREPSQLSYVLEHLADLVVKVTDGSGGYGMLVGPHATAAEREEFSHRIKANPAGYIAQPTLALSRVPVIVDGDFEGRHVDLRPYILYGEDIHVLPGGLTRVALTRGSLVVNSSQGGGSKDTWVIMDPASEHNGDVPGDPSGMSQEQVDSDAW